jgi:acyl dehydratase
MKFAEFYVDQVIEAGPVLVTQSEIVDYASKWDPQWFHLDAARAEKGPHNGLIASGWHTCGIAMRLMVGAALADSESFASPGLSELKWLWPVRPGDKLRVVATVTGVRRSAKDLTLGILTWRWKVINQADIAVLEVSATNLFKPV